MKTLPYSQGHTIDQELRKLTAIGTSLEKLLIEARELKTRQPELERLLIESHAEVSWLAASEDERLNLFI